MKLLCSSAGSPTVRRLDSRRRISSNITMISRRARLAPRQKCGPPAPKPRWALGYPHHLADDLERKRRGERLHEVTFPVRVALDGAVHQGPCLVADVLLDLGD